MLVFKRLHYVARRELRIDLLRCLEEVFVVLVEIGLPDREQFVERQIDHLLVKHLLREVLRPDGVGAFGTRQQVVLQPSGSVLHSLRGGVIGLLETCERLRVAAGGVLGPFCDIGLQEAD